MRKLLATISFIISFLPLTVYAGNISGEIRQEGTSLENVRLDGFADLKNMKFHSLTVNGHLRFFDVKIDRRLEVNGSADGRKIKCRNFVIHGSITADGLRASEGIIHGTATFSNVEIAKNIDVYGAFVAKSVNIAGKSIVYGNLSAENSKFQDIHLEAERATFLGTTARNIVVKASKKHKKQTITLKGNSEITGTIVFESGNGEVIVDETAKILGQTKGCSIKNSK
ncbi:MAG: hypothetical protein KA998_01075 [Rickettsiaceae bacterium]|nr:hypothetical protein [Rickettsiaceae bacterium]